MCVCYLCINIYTHDTPGYDENHNQGAGACNIESSVGDIGWWGGITTIVDIYDDKKRNFGFKNIR